MWLAQRCSYDAIRRGASLVQPSAVCCSQPRHVHALTPYRMQRPFPPSLCLQDSIMEARAQSAPLHLATSNPTAQELGNATQQKLRVCDICGALLSIFDSNDRLAEQ